MNLFKSILSNVIKKISPRRDAVSMTQEQADSLTAFLVAAGDTIPYEIFVNDIPLPEYQVWNGTTFIPSLSKGGSGEFQTTDNAGGLSASAMQQTGGHIVPTTTNVTDLGSPTKYFNHLHIRTKIRVGSGVFSFRDGSDVHMLELTSANFSLFSGRNLKFVTTGSIIEWAGTSNKITSATANRLRMENSMTYLTFGNSGEGYGIGINQASHPDALLSMTSTNQGFGLPEMTGAEAELIASGTPSRMIQVAINNGNGAIITSTGFWGYNGGWVKLG